MYCRRCSVCVCVCGRTETITASQPASQQKKKKSGESIFLSGGRTDGRSYIKPIEGKAESTRTTTVELYYIFLCVYIIGNGCCCAGSKEPRRANCWTPNLFSAGGFVMIIPSFFFFWLHTHTYRLGECLRHCVWTGNKSRGSLSPFFALVTVWWGGRPSPLRRR